jgi:hypothetical protein
MCGMLQLFLHPSVVLLRNAWQVVVCRLAELQPASSVTEMCTCGYRLQCKYPLSPLTSFDASGGSASDAAGKPVCWSTCHSWTC